MNKFHIIALALALILVLCAQQLYNSKHPHAPKPAQRPLSVVIIVTNGVGNEIIVEIPYSAWVDTNKVVMRRTENVYNNILEVK